jgi:predicted nuclease with TOPRIM domain
MKKETDTEMLARMVANGFSAMDKRFEAIDERFDVVDTRFDALEERMESLDGRMEGVEGRMDRLENVVMETNRLIDKVVMPTLDEHARRIKDLELKVA